MKTNNKKLFLDTTVFIDRIFKNLEKKGKIESVISSSEKIITSTYVKMEFRRRYIQDLVYLHNILVESGNLADAIERIKNLSPFQSRKMNMNLANIAHFFFDTKDDYIQGKMNEVIVEKIILWLKSEIDNVWDIFEKDIDEIINETDCDIARIGPVYDGKIFDNRKKKCKKAEMKCKIVEFFKKNYDSFLKIFNELLEIHKIDEEQEMLKKKLEKALKYPDSMADREYCWNCGDAIIAVESPNDAIIFTSNTKHFNPICKSIEKEVISY